MSLAVTLATEVVIAKTVDYGTSTVARHKDSPATTFFAALAREGLRAGWDRSNEMLPWWYGALSSGTTGATDFIAGSVLAGLVRKQFDAVLAQRPELSALVGTPSFDDVTAALRGDALPALDEPRAAALRAVVDAMVDDGGDGALLQRLLRGAPGVELASPIARHLQKALGTAPLESPLAGFVKRNLVSTRPAQEDPLGGTIVGHAIAGGATGVLTGHPELGVVVTLLDSLSEGLLAKKAMHGDYRALTAIKASLLLQGVREAEAPPDWKARINNRLLGWYSQMGEEVRLFGQDLARLANATDVVLDHGIVALANDVGAGAAHALVDAPAAAAAGSAPLGYARSVAHVGVDVAAAHVVAAHGEKLRGPVALRVRQQMAHTRHELEHHASVNKAGALADDFARERAALAERIGALRTEMAARLAELKREYPHIAAALTPSTATAPTAPSTSTLTSWWQTAREVVSVVATPVAKAVGAVGDAVLEAAVVVKDSALGRAALTLAHDALARSRLPALTARAGDAALAGAHVAIDKGGGVAVDGLLWAERMVQARPREWAALVAGCQSTRRRLGSVANDVGALCVHSGSRGALELARVLQRALAALDAALAPAQRAP
jgi:hypothetical protein